MIIECEHWSTDGENKQGGNCASGLYGGRPSYGVCVTVCSLYKGPKTTPPVTPSENTPKPMPRDLWPWIISKIAGYQSADERGVGDTIEAGAALLGGEWIKATLKKEGIDCGCDGRRDWLNARFPY